MSITDQALARVDEAAICFVASHDGTTPNVIPAGFKWIHEGRIVIADLFFGKTRANLASNPRVAVAIATPQPKRGLQLKGTAEVFTEGPVFAWVEGKLSEQGVHIPLHAAVRIEIDDVYELEPGPNAGRKL
jgi:uncharacterized protein